MQPRQDATGRCYCGASRVLATAPPLIVTYCHCSDCRRMSGAPVSAFVAYAVADVSLTTTANPVEINSGVKRWFCPDCRSPLAATYDYLPGQIYLPVGIMDDPAAWPPEQHSHTDSAVAWCRLADTLARFSGSGRTRLKDATQ